MTVTIHLPEGIEAQLRREMGNLDQIAKEALAIEAFRAAKLSLGQFAEVLGLSTYDADGLLKQRGVFLHLTDEAAEQERAVVRDLAGP